MRFQHIIEAIFHRPWLITEAGYETLAALVRDNLNEKLEVTRESKPKSQRGQDFWTGEPIPGMSVQSGIAHIPIHGVIGQRLGYLEKACGAVDVADLQSEIMAAEADPSVRAMLLNIDSPGGMASGTPELADRIMASSKPIYSFSDATVGSAAYWLASATKGLFGTRTSEWGSIGVYAAWMDRSQAYANAGMKVKVFSSGKYKGMGIPGTSLTAAQELMMQDSVMQLAQDFYDHVRRNRGAIDSETMQGQMFSAKTAKTYGLIDDVVASQDNVLQMI